MTERQLRRFEEMLTHFVRPCMSSNANAGRTHTAGVQDIALGPEIAACCAHWVARQILWPTTSDASCIAPCSCCNPLRTTRGKSAVLCCERKTHHELCRHILVCCQSHQLALPHPYTTAREICICFADMLPNAIACYVLFASWACAPAWTPAGPSCMRPMERPRSHAHSR